MVTVAKIRKRVFALVKRMFGCILHKVYLSVYLSVFVCLHVCLQSLNSFVILDFYKVNMFIHGADVSWVTMIQHVPSGNVGFCVSQTHPVSYLLRHKVSVIHSFDGDIKTEKLRSLTVSYFVLFSVRGGEAQS